MDKGGSIGLFKAVVNVRTLRDQSVAEIPGVWEIQPSSPVFWADP